MSAYRHPFVWGELRRGDPLRALQSENNLNLYTFLLLPVTIVSLSFIPEPATQEMHGNC
jgi:hypothetical protein